MRFALTNAMRIGIVAAEASGDALGGALIEAVRRRVPDARFEGVCGPRMQRAGCERWHGVESLSVMGLTEVLVHLPSWRGAGLHGLPAFLSASMRRISILAWSGACAAPEFLPRITSVRRSGPGARDAPGSSMPPVTGCCVCSPSRRVSTRASASMPAMSVIRSQTRCRWCRIGPARGMRLDSRIPIRSSHCCLAAVVARSRGLVRTSRLRRRKCAAFAHL